MKAVPENSVYHMTMISGLKNKFIRRFLMILLAPFLFVINMILTVVVTTLMYLLIMVGTIIRNTLILGSSIKEKW